jgi:hypothetical protein
MVGCVASCRKKLLITSNENRHGTDGIAAGHRVGTAIIMPRYMKRVAIVLFAVANWPKFKAAIAEN